MAEVTQRSFDLKSWQGLTEVLKVARESSLSPSEYAEFRNLVLEYAQQKGTDTNLKAKIDSIIASFLSRKKESAPAAGSNQTADADAAALSRAGRRIIPTFVVSKPLKKVSLSSTPVPQPVPPHEPEPQPVPVVVPEPPQVPVASIPQSTVPVPLVVVPEASSVVPVVPETQKVLKSVEEHRTRIMEIKRQVNALVENPITLVDHGNQLGREYMAALLAALKSTNPGSTHNLEGAMEVLEDVFARVLERVSHPYSDEDVSETTSPTSVESAPGAQLGEVQTVPSMTENEIIPPPPAHAPEVVQEQVISEDRGVSQSAPSTTENTTPTNTEPDKSPDEKRWSQEGGDADVKEQIEELRKQLSEIQPEPKGIRTGRRSFIPSLLDMEETPLPETSKAGMKGGLNDIRGHHGNELSPAALTQRPNSSMTGITLGTPQTELMAPEVTMALTELLHEWKVFASSGLFGFGPGGVEHPLYIKLARLPMGEVLSGRFDGVDMKVVHAIKDYVDAWRHEQGIAYNPSETFEHYLRRVAQRIMKRQKGILDA